MQRPGGWLDEAFQIKLRNHKKEAASHTQRDSKTMECEVTLRPDEERALAYTAHYTW